MSSLRQVDLVSIRDLTKHEIELILDQAKELKQQPSPHLLDGFVLGSCFFEPSTRTRLSFETAMERLGGQVIGFADGNVTSTKKKETLYDSIKIIGQYADVIVIRHPLDGAARRAAEATDIPVINAGDGANQHPTQTLLDLFTIRECQGTLDGLSIALVGDLKYGRTVHSLAQALKLWNTSFFFVAPPSLQMPEHIKQELQEHRSSYTEYENIEDCLNKVDILYMTRIQEERFPDKMDYERIKNIYRLTKDHLIDVKPTMRVLHPLPRVNEIHHDVDASPHAYYFEQAKNGLYVRQALLALVLGKL